MTHILKVNEMQRFSINENAKTLKDILVELSQKCDTNEVNPTNVIDMLRKELEKEMSASEEPVRIKGDVPYLDKNTQWVATYKYNGINYKVSFDDDSNTHYYLNNKWYYINGPKRGLKINGSTEDFNDTAMKVFVDKNGSVNKLGHDYKRTDVDMEATVIYLLKQWVYLQNMYGDLNLFR